jgi:hypothetical protein
VAEIRESGAALLFLNLLLAVLLLVTDVPSVAPGL